MAETSKPGCFAQALVGVALAYIFALVRDFLKHGEINPTGCFVLIALIAGLLIIASFGAALGKKKGEEVSRRRANRGQAILDALRTGGNPPPFNCFLRPFESTGHLLVSNADHIFGSGFSHGTAPSLVELESVLADVLAEWELELVALGQPGEHIGAGRVKTDDATWEDLMKLIVRHANVIYMVPSARQGTFAELQFLRDANLLRKCVFIMPPLTSRWSSDTFESQIPEKWAYARQRAASIDVELPEFDAEGALFIVDDNGKVKDRRAIGASTTIARFREALTELTWQLSGPSH